MPQKVLGRGECNGISIIGLFQMFSDEQTAHDWLVEQRWVQEGRSCPYCGGCNTSENKEDKLKARKSSQFEEFTQILEKNGVN